MNDEEELADKPGNKIRPQNEKTLEVK